jgi:pimeloyl-ACP methyl ester carboxylesterase
LCNTSLEGLALIRTLVLAHGAGSGPWVFEGWERVFAGVELDAVDLHAGLNVAEAAMSNYAAVVARAADSLARPTALCGWSMGGLTTMLAARQARAERLVLLEPSPPGEVQGFDPEIPLETGTFDPQDAYGPFPPGTRARTESRLARSERKRGISLPSLPCPSLVVYGEKYAEERGRAVARFYGSDELFLPGLDHWDLVRDVRVAAAVSAWLAGGNPVSDAEWGERPAPGGAGMTTNEG